MSVSLIGKPIQLLTGPVILLALNIPARRAPALSLSADACSLAPLESARDLVIGDDGLEILDLDFGGAGVVIDDVITQSLA